MKCSHLALHRPVLIYLTEEVKQFEYTSYNSIPKMKGNQFVGWDPFCVDSFAKIKKMYRVKIDYVLLMSKVVFILFF